VEGSVMFVDCGVNLWIKYCTVERAPVNDQFMCRDAIYLKCGLPLSKIVRWENFTSLKISCI